MENVIAMSPEVITVVTGLSWYLGSVVSSVCMDVDYSLKSLKYVADEGYKFKKVSKILKISSLAKFLTNTIPVFNLLRNFKRINDYQKGKLVSINKLQKKGIIEPMTKEEKEEYLKKPTGLKAMATTVKSKGTDVIKVDFDSEKVEKVSLEESEIKAEEQVKKLSASEQKQKLEDLKQKLLAESQISYKPGLTRSKKK